MDDFDLAEPTFAPLDIEQFGGTPPPVPQPQPGGGGIMSGGAQSQSREFAPLLALLPIAAKRGGQEAVAGILRGFQKARAARAEQARLGAQDQRVAARDEQQAAYQRAQIENQRRLQQRQFMSQFGTALGNVEDPDAVNALLELYGGQAQTFGLDRPTLERFAMQTVKPSTLQKKKADKVIAALKTQFGNDWMTKGAQWSHDLGDVDVEGKPIRVPLDEVLRRAGMERDPNAPAPAPTSQIDPSIPLDRQHAMALVAGNTALAQQIEKSMQLQDAAKRDPRYVDPVTAELRAMRLEQQRQAMASLPPAVARRVDSKAKGWDSLPIVKTTQKMAEAVEFANSLDPNTKNPADDQALIYAFAKAMDPDSVVREGEYATVQKYAQSWADSFKFNVARIFSNTQFLSPQARANMKATIQQKYRAGKVQYDNVRRSYANQINRITGANDGEDYLTDYAGGFPDNADAPGAPPSPVTVTPPARAGGAGPMAAPGANPFRR